MSKRKNSQAFIGRNRPPRVQITYDHETLGANKKVELPFVMAVMADLSGKSSGELPAIADRKFREIDQENFDQVLKSAKPTVQFAVPNKLTGEGRLAVDLQFEKLEDFSPAEVARKVEPLAQLLEARTQLDNLLKYMDGKSGAEKLLQELLNDPERLKGLLEGRANQDAAVAPQESDD